MQTSIEQEFRRLESRFWDAMQARDDATAMALTDEKSVVIGPRGVAELAREQLGEMLTQATTELMRSELDDKTFHVKRLTDDVAIVAYEVREDLIVDGKPTSLDAYDASVWVRRGDTWQCALHTETLRGDPFGRYDHDLVTEFSAKAIVRQLIEAHQAKHARRTKELLSPDFVWHYGSDDSRLDRDDWLAGMAEGSEAFSDLKIGIEQMLGDGNQVAVRLVIDARHTGSFEGIEATNARIRFASMWIVRVEGDHIAEVWMLDEDLPAKLQAG